MPDSSKLSILPATEADVPLIRSFIGELAEYEHLTHACVATEAQLTQTLFGPRRYAEVLIARHDDEPAGYGLFFHTYSTFLAQPGIYMEDLFVRPAKRRLGIGKALLHEIAKIALERGCGRLEWAVLNWNEPSIAFYRSLGAQPMNEWTVYRMDDKVVAMVARSGMAV